MTRKATGTWIPVEADTDFPIENIPFGIAELPGGIIHAVTRIGDNIIDLYELALTGIFEDIKGFTPVVFNQPFLNDFMALGKQVTTPVRSRIQEHFSHQTSNIQHPTSLKMLLPVRIGDYTDFYSSIDHATNVGKMFRDPANALLPNWRHLPVGYHGRASSIVVSGTLIHRPVGQVKPDNTPGPVVMPTRVLDFELEMAFVTGTPTQLGQRISTAEAEDHIFGMVLFNDLSARDIQRWEYVPLGPFLSKNFGSVISPWVVTLEALEPFRTAGPLQEPEVVPYLRFKGNKNYDVNLEVAIAPQGGPETVVCRTNFRHMYWNQAQQLAHQTINGCNINTGDLYASGTISGQDPGSFGSLLELTWNGSKSLAMKGGGERTFLDDGDTVVMRGFGKKGELRIGFGECVTTIMPAM